MDFITGQAPWRENRCYDRPKTKAMAKFLDKEEWRVIGLSIEDDGVFIYTDSSQWSDDAGAGTFRADSETAAIKTFYERVTRGNFRQ